MTKYEKQLTVFTGIFMSTLTIMLLTFPSIWVGAICIVPCIGSFALLPIPAFEVISSSKFGKWLSEDDK